MVPNVYHTHVPRYLHVLLGARCI